MEKLIQEINRLAKVAKERELTDDEVKLRDKYRKEYLGIFKKNMRSELEVIKIVDEIEINKTIDDVKDKIANHKGIVNISISGLKTKISYDEKEIKKEQILEILGLS